MRNPDDDETLLGQQNGHRIAKHYIANDEHYALSLDETKQRIDDFVAATKGDVISHNYAVAMKTAFYEALEEVNNATI